MQTLEQLAVLLADRRISKVAEATGLSYNTVKKVADGQRDVTLATLEKLSRYFESEG